MDRTKKDGITANFIFDLIYNIVDIIVPLLTAPYTSRVLGAENIGIYSYTYSIISTLVMFGALGTATYGQREIAAARDDVERRSKVFWEIFMLKGIATGVIFLAYIPFAIKSDYSIYYFLQAPYFIAAILNISFAFQGMEKFRYIAIRNCVVRVAGIILLFLLVKDKGDLWIYLFIVCLTQMLGNLSMWPYLRGSIKRVRLTWRGIFSHFRQVLIYFVPSITHQIYAVLDKAMLGWLVGSNYENGYYEQAHKIINLSINIVTAYTVVMRSRMSVLFAENNKKAFHEKLVTSYHVIAVMVFPMTLGLISIAAGMVPWFFGEGYDEVITLLYIFSPIFIFMGYSGLFGTHIITPTNRQIIGNYAQVSAVLVNIVLNAILIPRYYAVGAAVASVISSGTVLLVYLIFIRKEVSFREIISAAWKKVIASVIMFCALIPLHDVGGVSIIKTFCQVVIGCAVYFAALLIMQDSFVVNGVKKIIFAVKAKIKGRR